MAGNKLGIDDVSLAQQYAKSIQTQTDTLHNVIQTLNKTINDLHGIWHGPDSDKFHSTNWPTNKTELTKAHTDLGTLHTTLTKNISAQQSTSSTL